MVSQHTNAHAPVNASSVSQFSFPIRTLENDFVKLTQFIVRSYPSIRSHNDHNQ